MWSRRLSHLIRDTRIRAALLIGVAGLAVWGLVSQWTQVQAALDKLSIWAVLGSAGDVLAGLFCMLLAWRALLADLGSPLPLAAATRIMFVGQLGKYVPGAVWAVTAQVELGRDRQVPRRRSMTAGLVAMAITLVVGLVAAGLTLPLVSRAALRQYWWVLAVTPIAVMCLHPKVIEFALDLVLKAARQPPAGQRVSVRGMARALAWTTLGWLCYGLQAWLLVRQFAQGSQVHLLTLSLGAYALSWAVGFLIIFFPGGLGPREAALVAVLSPVMPAASALVVALASRMVMTAGDLVWAAAGLAADRASSRTAAR